MAKDENGNRTYQTFAAWRIAVKKLADKSGMQWLFEGNKDIAQAVIFDSVNRINVGEWEGDKGIVFSLENLNVNAQAAELSGLPCEEIAAVQETLTRELAELNASHVCQKTAPNNKPNFLILFVAKGARWSERQRNVLCGQHVDTERVKAHSVEIITKSLQPCGLCKLNTLTTKR